MRYPLPCPALCLGNMPAACACLGSVPVGAGRGRECPLSRSARRERTHPPRMVGSEGRRTTTRKNPQRGTRPPSLILPAPCHDLPDESEPTRPEWSGVKEEEPPPGRTAEKNPPPSLSPASCHPATTTATSEGRKRGTKKNKRFEKCYT